MLHPAWRVLVFVPLLTCPASAQPLRATVVPGDAVVVVPPRGQPLPQGMAASSQPAPLPAFPPWSDAGTTSAASDGASGAALPGGAVAGVLLPLGAAALLGARLPGSGGAAAAPAGTR